MNVLLANPPWFEKGHAIRAGSRWPHAEFDEEEQTTYTPFPFFLAYTASLLEKAGFKVKAIDALALRWSKEKFLKEVKKFSPDLVIIETATPTINIDLEYSKIIKKQTNAKIALSGSHASVFPKEMLKDENIDFVLIGEYELTALDLALMLRKRTERYNKIPGLAYKNKKRIFVNKRRPLLDVNKLPFPAWHLFDMGKYIELFCKYKPNFQILASRGCPYGCIYCLWPQAIYNTKLFRIRSAKNVIDECEEIKNKYSPKELYFDDDTFNLNQKKVRDLCEEYIKREINIPWSAMCHTNSFTKELLELMKKSGCEGVKLGVESGSQKILDIHRHGMKKSYIKKVFKWCKEIGIRTHATFIIGLPGETKQTLKDTFKFLEELLPESYQLSIGMPYPGTRYYEIAKKKGWLSAKKWEDFGSAHYMFQDPIIRNDDLSPSDLKEASVYGNFVMSKRLLAKRLQKRPQIIFEKLAEWYKCGGIKHVFSNMVKKGSATLKAVNKKY